MKYNPDQELTKEALDNLAKEDFDTFLKYLDSKASYLKTQSKPLTSYHKKRFASMVEVSAKEHRDREWHEQNRKLKNNS
jgi:hypothetical protein